MPSALDFDGAADYLSLGAGLTGAADSKTGIFATWFRIDGSDAANKVWLVNNTVKCQIAQLIDNKLRVYCRNAASGVILAVSTDAQHTSSTLWHHYYASWDLAVPTCTIAVDGVVVAQEAGATIVDDTVDYTAGNWTIGRDTAGTFYWDGALAELYFQDGEYLDPNVAANRAKFYIAGEAPDLGSDASSVTGTQPIIYMDFTTAGQNLGSGQDFVVNGSPNIIGGPPAVGAGGSVAPMYMLLRRRR